jgi:hypothetical protein
MFQRCVYSVLACFFEPSDDVSTRERRALRRDLEGAIERDELFLVYSAWSFSVQPVHGSRKNSMRK